MNKHSGREQKPMRVMEDMEREFGGEHFGSCCSSRDVAEFESDVQDKGGHYLLEADLRGFQKEDIHLDLNGDVLTINAERKSQHKEEKDSYIRCERSYGQYARQFDMSAVDTRVSRPA